MGRPAPDRNTLSTRVPRICVTSYPGPLPHASINARPVPAGATRCSIRQMLISEQLSDYGSVLSTRCPSAIPTPLCLPPRLLSVCQTGSLPPRNALITLILPAPLTSDAYSSSARSARTEMLYSLLNLGEIRPRPCPPKHRNSSYWTAPSEKRSV